MTFYLIFIGIITALFSLDYLHKNQGYGYFTIIGIFLVMLMVILRDEVGYDYLNYVGHLRGNISYLVESRVEWGFIAVVWLLQLLSADYFWLFFLFGTATILLIFRGVKLYTSHVRIAFLIYLLIPGLFLNSLSIIRQSIAIALMFNAFYYLFNRKYTYFWFLVGLGTLFHYSCLMIVPFYWLAKRVNSKAQLILIVGIPLSLILAKINITGIIATALLGTSKFVVYATMEDAGTGFTKLLVLNVSVIPYLIFYKRMDNLNRSFLVLVTFGLMMTNMFSAIGAITRIAYYFRIFEIVLLGNLVSYFKKGASQIIFCVCIFIYFFIMFYSSLHFDYTSVTEYPKMTPYQTFFDK